MNKKWLITVSSVLALSTGTNIMTAANLNGTTNDQIKYSNNGQAVSPSAPAVNIDGSLYLPVRALSESLGKYVNWDEFRSSLALTDKPKLTGKYSLNAPNLADGIKMGVGSSLTHLPGDPDNVFFSTADRGPNGQIDVNGNSRRTFPIQDYNPTIYKIKIAEGEITILEQFPLPSTHHQVRSGNTEAGRRICVFIGGCFFI